MASGDIGSVIQTRDFDSSWGFLPIIKKRASNVYAVCYRGPDNHGWLKTFNVTDNGATITELASFEFDSVQGTSIGFIQLSGDYFAIAYIGELGYGKVMTVSISADGNTIALVKVPVTFSTSVATNPWGGIIHISGDIYAIVWTGAGDDGFIYTISITNTGIIGPGAIASLEFDTDSGLYPDIIHISGDIYAIAYQGTDSDGWIKTVEIAADGTTIALTGGSFEYDASAATTPRITNISPNVYALVYQGPSNAGILKTISISDTGLTIAAIASASIDGTRGLWPFIYHVSGSIYAIPYQGVGDDGWIKTFSISSNGVSIAQVDSLEFDTTQGQYPQITWVTGNIYIIVYTGDSTVGKMLTLDIETVVVPTGTPTVTTGLCTEITPTTATGNGEITALGDSPVTQHGHCWSTAHDPTTADSKTQNGFGSIGAFTSAIPNLLGGTTYNCRAYATNAQGTSYGEEVSLVTPPTGSPTVTTEECSEVLTTTAKGNGTIVSIGDSAVTQHGHCWGTLPNPTIADSKTENGAGSPGAFTSAIAVLTAEVVYYSRAYATNTQGTAYGDNVFIRPSASNVVPTVTTGACTSVKANTATGHGTITALGYPASVLQHGHCWSTSLNPTIADSKTQNGIGAIGAFSSGITGLNPGTIHHSRAYATNQTGTAYGADVTIFTGGFGGLDGSIQVDFTKGANGDAILVWRYADTNNYVYLYTGNGTLVVAKVEGGVQADISSVAYTWAVGDTKRVRVVIHGPAVWVFAAVVGAPLEIKIITSSTLNPTSTVCGIGGPSDHADARWDNFGYHHHLGYGKMNRITPYPPEKKAYITATDDLKKLANTRIFRRNEYLTTPDIWGYISEIVYRISNVLSVTNAVADSGESVTQSIKNYWNIEALKQIQKLESEENGLFYQDQMGVWRFEERGHRAASPHDASRCTISDNPDTSDLYFTDIKWNSGDEDIINSVLASSYWSVYDVANPQEIWRSAEADVFDGGIGASVLAVPAGGSVVVYFATKEFDAVDTLIAPTSSIVEEKLEGTIVNGPFLIGETVTGAPSGATGVVIKQGGGWVLLRLTAGNFGAGDTATGGITGAAINGGLTITQYGDYLANAAPDGTGADKTAQLTVTLAYDQNAYYGKGGKLTLANADAAEIFVTFLRVRGDGYGYRAKSTAVAEDATSKADYGESRHEINCDLLQSTAELKALADDVLSKNKDRKAKPQIVIPATTVQNLIQLLALQISDRINLVYAAMGINEDFYINAKEYQVKEGGTYIRAVLTLEEVS